MLKKSAKPKKRYILTNSQYAPFKIELKRLYLLKKTYSEYSYSNFKVIDTKHLNYFIVRCILTQYEYFKLIINLVPLTKTILSSGTIKKITKSLNKFNSI